MLHATTPLSELASDHAAWVALICRRACVRPDRPDGNASPSPKSDSCPAGRSVVGRGLLAQSPGDRN
jgi:hypothetical protein